METYDRRRHRNWLALLFAVVALVAVGAIATGLVLRSRIDPKSVQRKLVTAVERETGRHLRIAGPVTFHFLPRPEIAASDITLSNIDGGTAPQMLHVRAAEADIAILPLLRREVRLSRLTLYAPQVTFERRPDGVWNWTFQRQAPPPAPHRSTARPGQVHAAAQPWSVGLDRLRIEGGGVTVLDRHDPGPDGSGRMWKIDIRDLMADSVSSAQPAWRLRLLRHGVPVTVEARTGPLTSVTQGWPEESWPLRLMVMQDNGSGNSASARLAGTIGGGPSQRRFALDMHASLPDLVALQPLMPEVALPSVQAAALATRLEGALGSSATGDGARLSVQSLHAQTGAAAIGRLHLLAGSVDAAAKDAPLAVHLNLPSPSVPVTLTGRIGSFDQVQHLVAALLARPAEPRAEDMTTWLTRIEAATTGFTAPLPVDISLAAGKATAALTGQLASAGSRLRVQADVPDLQAVVARSAHLTKASLAATLSETSGGRLALDGLALHSDQGDLAGRAELSLPQGEDGLPQFDVVLQSAQLDTDALREDTASDPHAGLLAPHGGSPSAPQAPPAPAAAPKADPTPKAADTAPGDRGFDRKLPFAWLQRADGHLALQIGTLVAGGVAYHGLDLHAAVSGGRLDVEPMALRTPQGPMSGRLSAEAASNALGLTLHAPAIPAVSLAPLLPGWAPALKGVKATLQVEADLQGNGDTLRAAFGSLNGTLGLSSVDGSVPNGLLNDWIRKLGGKGAAGGNGLAGLARGLSGSLARLDSRGETTFRCFASAAHIAGGTASLDPIAFDTSRLTASGHGTLELASDRLDLHLMTSVLVGGAGASTPFHVYGTPDAVSLAPEAGLPGGRFGIVIGGPVADPCAGALEAARFGQPGPPPAARKQGGKAADVLRGLGLLH